jgi:hypothetical protein
MKIDTMIGNPGTTLFCAAPMGTTAGQGAGMRLVVDSALSARHAIRLRSTADWIRVFGNEVVPAPADLPMAKQPKIYVPSPPHERSP